MKDARALAQRVFEQMIEAGALSAPPAEEIVDLLSASIADAFAAWSSCTVVPEVWCRYLAARLLPLPDLEQSIRGLRTRELFLCCACAMGDRNALAAFQEEYLPIVQSELRKLRLGQGLREEVQQKLVMSLLVAAPGVPPLITRFAATGRLSSWLRIVTARMARKALDREKRTVLSDDERLAEELVEDRSGADLLHARTVYREAFGKAFREAVRSLAPREINLLRQRFVDELGLEEMAVIYRVHHTTIHRWIEKARLLLFRRTYESFSRELQIPPAECSTIFRMIQSDIDLSLHSMLGPDASIRGQHTSDQKGRQLP